MEVRLKDIMCRSFRFLISDEFRIELFRKAIEKEGMLKILAKKLACSPDSIRTMRTGKTRFIKWQIVKKLIEIAGISETELEPHVLAVKGGMSGKETEVKFPIKESPELALLVAKGLGDGSIEKAKLRFSYWNNEQDLIDEVCRAVSKAVGETRATITELKDGRIQAKFCPFVGLILYLNGVPMGNKTFQEFDVPDWIKNGSQEMKALFLRGLFDDEACVKKKTIKDRGRGIFIAQGKWSELRDSLEEFFKSVKMMLLELNIESTNVIKQEIFMDEREREKVVLRFGISRKKNLENYLNNIGFTSLKKTSKLKEAIKSFVDIQRNRKVVFGLIQSISRPIPTTKVSKLTGINLDLASYYLNGLYKEGKIFKNKETNPVLWFKSDGYFTPSKKERVLQTIKKFGPLMIKDISLLTGIKEGYLYSIVEDLEKNNMINKINKDNKSNLWS